MDPYRIIAIDEAPYYAVINSECGIDWMIKIIIDMMLRTIIKLIHIIIMIRRDITGRRAVIYVIYAHIKTYDTVLILIKEKLFTKKK